MTRKVCIPMVPVVLLIAGLAITLSGCKPITYYLGQVYKAYGTVTEKGSGVPLESVEVFLGTYQYSVLTNGLGDYGIELSEGTWTLQFVKSGYVTESRTVTVNAQVPRIRVEDVALTRLGSKLSGTWASPEGITVPDGIYGFLGLVAGNGQPTDPPLYWTRSSAFSGGTAGYSIAGIAAGSYTLFAFIDMNGSSPNNTSAFPDAGDYYLKAGIPVTITGDQALNLDSSVWGGGPPAGPAYVGTWFNSAYSGGEGGSYDAPDKIVMTAGSFEFYDSGISTGISPFYLTGDRLEAGYHYFQGTSTPPGTSPTVFFLLAVSDNNGKLNITSSPVDYPTDVTTSLEYWRQP